MFGLSLAEIAVILLVAILVIGPKELPTVIRAIVKLFRQIRGVMHECRKSFDEAIKESELLEIRDDLKDTANTIIDLDGKPQRTYDISAELEADKSRKGGTQ